MREPRGHLPKMDFAAVALDYRADVVDHESEQTVEVTFPQIRPIGHAAVVEFQERTGANSQARRMCPINLCICVGPIASAFHGFDSAPRQRQRDHVERVNDVPRDVRLRTMTAQVNAEPRRELSLLSAPHRERLADVL
jgi:hypothetical protein